MKVFDILLAEYTICDCPGQTKKVIYRRGHRAFSISMKADPAHRSPILRRQSQLYPQTELTLLTQARSHWVSQHEGSTAQISLTQLGLTGGLSQPGVSRTPVEQTGCAQAPALSSQVRLEQIVRTSSTQKLSHSVPQQ